MKNNQTPLRLRNCSHWICPSCQRISRARRVLDPRNQRAYLACPSCGRRQKLCAPQNPHAQPAPHWKNRGRNNRRRRFHRPSLPCRPLALAPRTIDVPSGRPSSFPWGTVLKWASYGAMGIASVVVAAAVVNFIVTAILPVAAVGLAVWVGMSFFGSR